MTERRVGRRSRLHRANGSLALAALSLASCNLEDDIVVRRVATGGGGASGASGGGGPSGNGGTAADSCDENRPQLPALSTRAGPIVHCSAWVARRSFGHALCSCDSLRVPNVLATDSVDSGAGGPGSPGGGAAVGINGAYAGGDYVRVGGSLTVAGEASLESAGGIDVAGDLRLRSAASSAGPIFVGRDAWLLGDVSTLSIATVARDLHLGPNGALDALGLVSVGGATLDEPFDWAPPCACGPEEVLDIAAIVNEVVRANDNARIGLALDALSNVARPTTIDLACGRYALEDISGSAPIAIHVRGHVLLAVRGNVNAGAFTLSLDESADIDWFISGSLALSPLTGIGTLDRRAAVRAYVLGPEEIALPGTPNVVMNLYAPNASVTVGLPGNVYGALFARAVEAPALLFVNYDRSIVRADDDCAPATSEPCASCEDCAGGSACVTGVCGECTADSDCCFPLTCQNGSCEPLRGRFSFD
jgi:hypothetical protein